MTWTWSVLKALLIWTGKMPRVRTFLHEKLPGIMLGGETKTTRQRHTEGKPKPMTWRKERSGEGEARTAYAVEAEQNPKESRMYEPESR